MRRTVPVMPRELKLGDVINDGKHKLEVLTIAHYACSKRGTHVNGETCYPWSIPVRIHTN